MSHALDGGVASDLTRRSVAVLPAADPGKVVGLVGAVGSGLTRFGLVLLAEPARRAVVAALDVRGWLCPAVAWEVGIPEGRLVVVRCPDRELWPKVAAALLDGVGAVYAEVPAGVPDAVLRRLGALARARAAALVLRPVNGGLPSGLAHLNLVAREVRWEGTDAGHGRLTRRRLILHASGRGALGIDRILEVDDDGTNAVRVVSELGAAQAGRAAG